MSSSKSPATSSGFLDGVENPSGLLIAGFTGVFFAMVPATLKLAEAGGRMELAVNFFVRFLIPNGSNIPADRMIPAMAAIYSFFTFAMTGALSAAGSAAATKEGGDQAHPRTGVDSLRGLPLRLRSAHYQIMEMFPSWAISAALAQAIAPANQQIINLLGMHVLLKTAVHYPSYILMVPPVRTAAHVFATSSVVGVAYLLAQGAK